MATHAWANSKGFLILFYHDEFNKTVSDVKGKVCLARSLKVDLIRSLKVDLARYRFHKKVKLSRLNY